jgi:plastocyanin
MTRSTLTRLGLTFAVTGAVLAACAGGATTTSPSAATSAEPSVAASESASASATTESPSASASAAVPSGSPAARTVQIYAIDGGFQNAPIDPTPGTVLTFRNLGTEAHEMVVIKRNADATEKQTFEDLSKVDPADLLKFITVVGVLAADPNSEATGQIELTEPGDYAIVDLLAKGTTTAPASPDPMAIPTGVPNLADGMFSTFAVIEPEAS